MLSDLPKILGTNNRINLKTGGQKRVVLLNNAATTPPFWHTIKTVNQFLQTYGAMHRGAGPHATKTYKQVEKAINTIRTFVNANHNHSIIFTENTSGAINLFARLLPLTKDDVIITSEIEHTSNNLPWHYNTNAKIVEIKAFNDGSLDYDDLKFKLGTYNNVKLIAITGASNLTGYIPDIKRISALAHQHGAKLFIDAAQLAPHRPINMIEDEIDALAFSAHKIYAPFGLGVLILPNEFLNQAPVNPGGGSIDMISEHNIVWAAKNERHQTGTWNVTGIIGLAASCELIMQTGWENILKHEKKLVKYTTEKLANISGLKLYVPKEKYFNEDRIGTFPFTLNNHHQALLSCILEHEYAIETRAGTICNHRLVKRWFNISDEKQNEIEKQIKNSNRLASYGIVRASLGIHNTKEDIDLLANALTEISKYGPKLKYQPLSEKEIFKPI